MKVQDENTPVTLWYLNTVTKTAVQLDDCFPRCIDENGETKTFFSPTGGGTMNLGYSLFEDRRELKRAAEADAIRRLHEAERIHEWTITL